MQLKAIPNAYVATAVQENNYEEDKDNEYLIL